MRRPGSSRFPRVLSSGLSIFAALALAWPGAAAGSGLCAPDGQTLCLQGGRFRVQAEWQTRGGGSGPARMVGLGGDSGYFSFFQPANVEGVIKVLDGCPVNGRFWVFVAGMTNLRVQVRVEDTVSGRTRVYFNSQGVAFPAIFDTSFFRDCTTGVFPPVTAAGPDHLLPSPGAAGEEPVHSRLAPGRQVIDLAELTAVDPRTGARRNRGLLGRVLGSEGSGFLGLPVAGGRDLDGDGWNDAALAAFLASPRGRDRAGRVHVLFGSGVVARDFSTGSPFAPFLAIAGGGPQETAGNEIWIDDVTGDGLGDLLICRQNYTPLAGREGVGALTILPGGPSLPRSYDRVELDLASLPAEVAAVHVVGGQRLGRFCIWARTGDVDGDGIADIAVGADQEGVGVANGHAGAVYVLRGGPHLAVSRTVDLSRFDPLLGGTALAGHLARILPPAGSFELHFGATCQVADLDGNGRGEVLAAAALLRGGAGVPAFGQPGESAHSRGGAPAGRLYIAWDDNFPAAPWPSGYTVSLASPPGGLTELRGGPGNQAFGEEIAGGDFDGDGAPDLFVGDLGADVSFFGARPGSGMGMVFYGAAALRGLAAGIDALPPGLAVTRILGAGPGDLAGDTAVAGDFDGDGMTDLAISSPHASPQGRHSAGLFHLFHGQPGGWPALIDLLVPPASIRLTEVHGARGAEAGDRGDTLAYSMASGDLDGDGRPDLLFNEMLGNGVFPEEVDVGNLAVLSGQAFSTGEPCASDATTLCLEGGRFRVRARWGLGAGASSAAGAVPLTSAAGYFWFFSPSNLELLAKALNGCPVNDRFWLFAAPLTNVGVHLVVEDTETGTVSLYRNLRGNFFQPIQDTGSFATCP